MNSYLIKGALFVALLAPVGAYAQGVIEGSSNGIEEGNKKAGPVGAVVGGAVGAVTGGVNGLLGIDQRPRFRQYVVTEHRPSFRYDEDVEVGTVLPPDGVEYYEVPPEYGVTRYRYTVVNDQVVLVDPSTRSVVEIVH
ncbi:DUF1236 domain-containing protein [Labrys monachus]|uniref:DUF1236 domain-containing protein n=1 Tax=Labrys monachus TaxID=217067 RepID=A0ABU0F7S1_9HYPH|nr:DUF1236 domain-containing protein [Labrys monachus]MDQ0390658.1 hypothetical protein [Labrys monachus]